MAPAVTTFCTKVRSAERRANPKPNSRAASGPPSRVRRPPKPPLPMAPPVTVRLTGSPSVEVSHSGSCTLPDCKARPRKPASNPAPSTSGGDSIRLRSRVTPVASSSSPVRPTSQRERSKSSAPEKVISQASSTLTSPRMAILTASLPSAGRSRVSAKRSSKETS